MEPRLYTGYSILLLVLRAPTVNLFRRVTVWRSVFLIYQIIVVDRLRRFGRRRQRRQTL